MHKGIRNYRPTPTAHGLVCQPSQRRASAPSTPGGSQRNSPTRSHSPTRQMLHHMTAPGVASYALDPVEQRNRSTSRSRKRSSSAGASTSGGQSPSAARRRQASSSSQQQQHASSSSSTGGFDYEAEVEKLLAAPTPFPLPAPQGAPTFVIVASAAEDGGAGVPVTLANSFDRARAAASGVWKVPKYENPNAVSDPATPQKQTQQPQTPTRTPKAKKF